MKAGYVYVQKKGHPFTDKWGFIREHRLIMEGKIGRYLQPNEIVHHINGDTQDNRIENLVLTTQSVHMKITSHKRCERNNLVCQRCGSNNVARDGHSRNQQCFECNSCGRW